MNETELSAFINGLRDRPDVAKHVRRAIWKAHYGRIPTLRAHLIAERDEEIWEAAEWARYSRQPQRFVVIVWRKDGTRVRYTGFDRLEPAIELAGGRSWE